MYMLLHLNPLGFKSIIRIQQVKPNTISIDFKKWTYEIPHK